MAKRRAEDTLLHDFPSKKYCRAFCKVGLHLGSMDPTGGVSPPSLLALLGGRGRKRPHYSEDLDKEEQEETAAAVSPCRKDTRTRAASVLSEQTSGSFHDRRSSSSASSKSKKRARDSGSETVPEDKEKVS